MLLKEKLKNNTRNDVKCKMIDVFSLGVDLNAAHYSAVFDSSLWHGAAVCDVTLLARHATRIVRRRPRRSAIANLNIAAGGALEKHASPGPRCPRQLRHPAPAVLDNCVTRPPPS